MPRTPPASSTPRGRTPGGAAVVVGTVVLIALSAAAGVACRADGASTTPAAEPAATPSPAPGPSPATVTAGPAATASSQAGPLVAQVQDAPTATDAASAASAKPGSHAEVEARLDRLLKAAEHCSSADECRSVAVGGKACGGPTGYRAYSAKGADPQAVEALARQEHEAAMAEARASGRVSNCMMLADPGAACVQGKCTTGGPGAPGAPVSR